MEKEIVRDGKTIHFTSRADLSPIAFPEAEMLSCSFDRELIRSVGAAQADCAREKDYAMIGMPAPERFSSNLYVAGVCALAYMEGIREKGILAMLPPCTDGRYAQAYAMLARIEGVCVEGKVEDSFFEQAAEAFLRNVSKDPDFFLGVQHHLARRVARESAVMLKNDGVLPISSTKRICFLGRQAVMPRYRVGEAHPDDDEPKGALFAARSVANVRYAAGYSENGERDEALLAEALAMAVDCDVPVVFLGVPEAQRGFPGAQVELLRRVAEVNAKTVAVLYTDRTTELPCFEGVAAILLPGLAGSSVGGATVDLLFGALSPCGRLASSLGDFSFGHGLTTAVFEKETVSREAEAVTVRVKNSARTGGKCIVIPALDGETTFGDGFGKLYVPAHGETCLTVERNTL